ncbi:MAG: hypothetical protein ABWX74_10465 [Aeromicrobium sp.]
MAPSDPTGTTRVPGRRVLWIAVAAVLVLLTAADVSRPARDAGPQALPYSAPDVVNPMRGQFDNILTGLFPQSNDAQSGLPDWPGSMDAADRFTWRSLQPVDPATLPADASDEERYDFSQIDRALGRYGSRGMRLSLRISSYDSCCDPSPPNGVNIGVPDWFAARDGAVQVYDLNGIAQVIPDWNGDGYLDAFGELLAALGRRYDRDERLAIFEMSGYGDFSENVLPVLRDDLDDPGPAEEFSEAVLGYYSQYRDQVITAASVERLVAANLRAFPRTQMVTAPGNPQIVKQLMRDSDALAGVSHPVGVRSDCLGVFDVLPAWAVDPSSEYVARGDPIIDVLVDRLTDAPVLTEWCQLPDDVSRRDYYARGLASVLDRHVSMTASSGFPDQFDGRQMEPDLYDLWSRANIYAGYRYDASGEVTSEARGVRAEVLWTNRGVSSTHERWTVSYQLIDAAGDVIATVGSGLDLRDIDTAQSSSPDADVVPTPATATDSASFAGPVPRGTYTVAALVTWDEHKADATHPVEHEPMNLAMPDRRDGAYPIGSVTVR